MPADRSTPRSVEVTDVPKRSWLQRMERRLIGLVMAVMAYGLEKAVLRSIRRGGAGSRATVSPSS